MAGGDERGSRKTLSAGGIQMGSKVFLGRHATVLGHVKVGDDVQIGAGAVVVSDIRSGAIVGGVPARELRTHGPTHLEEQNVL